MIAFLICSQVAQSREVVPPDVPSAYYESVCALIVPSFLSKPDCVTIEFRVKRAASEFEVRTMLVPKDDRKIPVEAIAVGMWAFKSGLKLSKPLQIASITSDSAKRSDAASVALREPRLSAWLRGNVRIQVTLSRDWALVSFNEVLPDGKPGRLSQLATVKGGKITDITTGW